MLFLISSAPDTKEFKTACRLAADVNADICLLQNAVYASRNPGSGKKALSPGGSTVYVLQDDVKLRGIREDEVSGELIDYGQLVDVMTKADKVAGIF